MLRKLAATAASAALLGSSILVPLAAADNQAGNTTTGPFANNYNEIKNESEVKVENVNDTAVFNDVYTDANTGRNSCSYNTLGCSIGTGNASNNTSVQTTGGINTVSVQAGPAGSDNSAGNNTTGPFSNNQNRIENKTRVKVVNDNTAVVRNQVVVQSNTGENVGDFNTGPSLISTGDASTTANVGTHVNDSAVAVQSMAGGSGGNFASNLITGSFSTNYNEIVNKSKAKVTNVNDAAVFNDVYARSNSGANSASYITLGADMRTGDASTGVGVGTTGNINTVQVAMAMGGFAEMKSNDITGPYSNNQNRDENKTKVEVYNSNNKCESRDCRDYEDIRWGVFNRDVDIANTGDNVGDFNTGPSLIQTGLAMLTKLVDTWLNDNFVKIE